MIEQPLLFDFPKPNTSITPKDFKVVALRECAPSAMQCCEPKNAYDYWKQAIASHPFYNPHAECMATVLLNTRKRIIGHTLVSIGTLNTLLIHSREVFRAAIVAAADSVLLMHNHPSGDPTPSEADVKVTRDLIRAGQVLRIEVADHVVVGYDLPDRPGRLPFNSLRELGYFYT